MKILVPVKRVSDPDNANKVKVAGDGKAVTTDGLEWKPNPFDEYAVETALRLNENAKGNEKLGETVVVTLGPKDSAQTLRQALDRPPPPLRQGVEPARRPNGRAQRADLAPGQRLSGVFRSIRKAVPLHERIGRPRLHQA